MIGDMNYKEQQAVTMYKNNSLNSSKLEGYNPHQPSFRLKGFCPQSATILVLNVSVYAKKNRRYPKIL